MKKGLWSGLMAVTVLLTVSGCREEEQVTLSPSAAGASLNVTGPLSSPSPSKAATTPQSDPTIAPIPPAAGFIPEPEALTSNGAGAGLAMAGQEASFLGDASASTLKTSLRLEVIKDKGGFHIQPHKSQADYTVVVQTVLQQKSEGSNKLMVHLIRRLTYANGGNRYLLDAAIVNPATAQCRVVPLADVPSADEYAIASLAKIYGFRGDHEVILVRPQAALRYDAVSLDLVTGAVKLLAEGVIPDPSPDFLAAGWLDEDGQRLYLNSFQNGDLWMADLSNGQVEKSPKPFKHKWPMIGTGPSPDGGVFWHADREGGFIRMYNDSLKELKALPSSKEFHSPAGINWSPDSQFGVYEYTFDQSEDNVIWQDTGPKMLAPQGIRMIGRNGKDIWIHEVVRGKGLHMEWAGWFAGGDAGLVRFYELEQQRNQPRLKVHADYALAGLVPNSPFVFLHRADGLEELNTPEPVFGSDSGAVILVDRKSGLYWEYGADYSEAGKSHARLISRPGDKHFVWVVSEGGNPQTTTICRYDPATKSVVRTPLPESGG